MPAMSTDERDAFLSEPGILCRIATLQPDGSPHNTPVWFIREGDDILITPRARSAWLDHLRRDPRVALCIDEQPSPYRKITVEGSARVVFEPGKDDVWRDIYRRIARRYVPVEGADRYIEETIDQPRALIAVPLSGSKVRSWRMPVSGEAYPGIWHRRYYAEGSKMAARAEQAASEQHS